MNPTIEPDFYLSSSEGYDLLEPRKCWVVGQLKTTERDDLALLRIQPPITGKKYGLAQDIERIVVAPRHAGVSLFPVSAWPVYVHVARLPTDNLDKALRPDDLKVIAWAELHQTEADAREGAGSSSKL